MFDIKVNAKTIVNIAAILNSLPTERSEQGATPSAFNLPILDNSLVRGLARELAIEEENAVKAKLYGENNEVEPLSFDRVNAFYASIDALIVD